MTKYDKVGNAMKKVFFLAVAITLLASPTAAKTDPSKFVRTANYYLKAGTSLQAQDYKALAAFDLVILPMEAQAYNRDFFAFARVENPDIIILPYVPSRSINVLDLDDGARIRARLKSGIDDAWYLRGSTGAIVKAWPGTIPVNVATGWNQYLPQFVKDTILSTGLWDGVFYDEVEDDVTFLNGGDIDLDRDGSKDGKELSASLWQGGMRDLFKNSRNLFGPSAIILSNGSSLPDYQPYLNGRMFENFPTEKESNGWWQKITKSYLSLFTSVTQPPVFVINGNTRNSGKKEDYRRMRFALTSALLGDGYFGFDFGDRDHGQLWRYDEFDIRLGRPGAPPKNILKPSESDLTLSVWKRDYQHGAVFVNATDEPVTIDFDEEFEKFRGAQDPTMNDGSIISTLDLEAHDGVVVLRPLHILTNALFVNGTFARVLDVSGSIKRNGFFSYVPSSKGGTQILLKDLDGDGTKETVSADASTVTVARSDGSRKATIQPLGPTWRGGFSVAAADVDGDGVDEIIAGPASPLSKGFNKESAALFAAHTTMIMAFDSSTGFLVRAFPPFGNTFRGAVSVGAKQSSSDQHTSIAVGAGKGSPPRVRVFDQNGAPEGKEFLAYNRSFRGGVSVALAHLENQKQAPFSVLAAPGPGIAPQIRVFSRNGREIKPGFLAFHKTNKNGVKLAAVDLDGDGVDEIIPMTTSVFTLSSIGR